MTNVCLRVSVTPKHSLSYAKKNYASLKALQYQGVASCLLYLLMSYIFLRSLNFSIDRYILPQQKPEPLGSDIMGNELHFTEGLSVMKML